MDKVGFPITQRGEPISKAGSSSNSASTDAREIVKEIATDIGADTAAYIEVMYHEAVKATSSTFLLSVRNHVYNEIMAALEINEAGAIKRRLDSRKKFRKEWRSQYRKIRKESQ